MGEVANGQACLQVHICASWNILEMGLQNLAPALNVRVWHGDVPVKAAWAYQGLIQGLWEVSGCHHNDPLTRFEPVEEHTRNSGQTQ